MRELRPQSRLVRGDGASSPRGALVQLGQEPPLSSSGGAAREIDRRDVNLRWLCASVLTGITGAALIGASIYVALEGATTDAQPPERAVASRVKVTTEERSPATARKGDRLNRSEMIASAKQEMRAPVTIRTGEREVIKVRHFVRIATNLSLNVGTHATDIPPFNPWRLFAQESGERAAPEPPPEPADADVSVVKQDLTLTAVDPKAPALTDEDVLAILAEEQRLIGIPGRRSEMAIPAQQMLSRTLRQPDALGDALGYAQPMDAPFTSIEVRVVPENVTSLEKADNRGSEPLFDERDVTLGKGETLEMALRAYGAPPDRIRSITTALSARVKIATIPEGQRVRLLIAPGPRLGDPRQIMRIVLYGERGIEAIAASNDRGVFVSVNPPAEDLQQQVAAGDEEEEGEGNGGVRLYESLYETVAKNDLDQEMVEELIRIFGYDIDFQRRVGPGDSFEIFLGADDEESDPEILYASLTLGGEARRVYRFQGESGAVDYFDELGRSLKKFLLRKPITEGILRSGFGMRRHPILGYAKMHTGVDWANRIGTPIVAAGNGTVIKAEWDSGYGRRIEIEHANGYVTAYSHQSRFAKGIARGVRVRQGQVIGYVGNTGLSTGPHLHYEVIVNGHLVDPMKIRVPRGEELDGRALAEFKRQREQVDDLLERVGQTTRMAQRADLR
ncbi:M23 family metallopeptidase [Microvirga massiliensis]|uniref:M23 family metallopeptidase n=1 Tax=Microvirga massiliensis TaxID=1033741 RepID=UPI00062BB3E4|nr:M23 family metallopeptidase [Microvirga massiliensis]